MGKAPAFQFYVKDWLCDPELRLASVLSRGAWIDCLCFMWENSKRGKLTATPLKFARLISGSLEEALYFLNELNEYEFGDIEIPKNTTFPLTENDCNVKVTIINRRMHSEYKDRQNTRLRVKKHRKKKTVTKKKQKCNGNVTVTSPSPSPSPTTNTKTYSVEFSKFFNEYPLKVEKKATFEKWKSLKKQKLLPSLDILLSALEKQKQWRENANGEFRPKWKHPKTWLNQGCWEDEIPEDENDGLSRFLQRHQNAG